MSRASIAPSHSRLNAALTGFRPHSSAFAAYLTSVGAYLVSFGMLFVIWHIMATYLFPSVLFAPPLAVFRRTWELAQSGQLFADIAISMQRILLGFLDRVRYWHSGRAPDGERPPDPATARAVY